MFLFLRLGFALQNYNYLKKSWGIRFPIFNAIFGCFNKEKIKLYKQYKKNKILSFENEKNLIL